MRRVDRGHPSPRVVSAGLVTVLGGPAVRWRIVPALLIVAFAVLAGLAAGDPAPQGGGAVAGVGGGAVLFAGARWPFAGLLVMLASSILLVVAMAVGLRSVNTFDLLLPPVLLASAFGTARRDAVAHARAERGPAHDSLHAAERGFTRAVLMFYALAAASLVRLASVAGVNSALDSGLVLVRALQGVLLYPLCAWWLRTHARVEHAWSALFVAGAGLAVVNLIGVTAWHVQRAGMTLFLNNPDPLSSPNEAGTATLIVGVVLLVRQAMRPDWKNLALGALMVVLLGLTQSRSGILAWAAFALFTLRWVRPARLLTGALAIGALLPLLPQRFWIRMMRSVVVERGSNEAFSFFQRVFGWKAAWRAFLAQPLMGVGYLGFRFVSHRYNELRVVLITVENYFFEILVSMGVVGLALLAIVIVKLFQLGREVGRTAPPGTLAHHMARFHAPLVLGLLVANLTGDNFMGIVGVAQMSIWTALLVRAGHAAVAEGARG